MFPDENINNLSSLDDIDDFVTEDLTNTAFPQLEANIIVNYVDIDLETNSIIPTTTGATKSLGDVIPQLKGKVEGISIRVPTPNVSLLEFVFSSKKNFSVEEINDAFLKASKSEIKTVKPIPSFDTLFNIF